MVGGAVLVGDARGAHAERARRAPRRPRARAAWCRRPRSRRRASTSGARAGGHGHQRVQRERLVRRERLERRWRPSSGRRAGRGATAAAAAAISPSGTHSSTAVAPRGVRAAPERAEYGVSGRAEGGGERGAEAARADDGDRVQFPHGDTGFRRRSREHSPPSARLKSVSDGHRSGAARGAQGRLAAGAGVHASCPQLASTRQTVVFGSGQRRRRPDVRRRGARRQRGQAGPAVRRPGRPAARHAARRDRPRRAATCSSQRAEVPASRQPRSAAAGDRQLPGLPVPPARADRAAGGLHARQLLHEAAARRPDRDHAPARARGDPADRAAARAAVPDLPPGGGALHAVDARDAARGLPPAARSCWRSIRPSSPSRSREPEPVVPEPELAAETEPEPEPERLSSGSSEPPARRP